MFLEKFRKNFITKNILKPLSREYFKSSERISFGTH